MKQPTSPQTKQPTKSPVKTPVDTVPPVVRTPSPTRSPPTDPPTRKPTIAPTRAPTLPPTMAPTVTCNLDKDTRELLIRVVVNSISDMDEVDTPGTPQNQAFNWIVNEDMRYLCPEDPSLPSRYGLVVFYYSTRGDRWLECSAPEDFRDPASIAEANANCSIQPLPGSGSDAWLTPSDACQWGGLVCNEGRIEILDIGTYLDRNE
jgi:hypothetical protein